VVVTTSVDAFLLMFAQLVKCFDARCAGRSFIIQTNDYAASRSPCIRGRGEAALQPACSGYDDDQNTSR
jgi:hypothetical protein